MIREFIKRLLGIRPLTSEEYINNLRIKGIKNRGGVQLPLVRLPYK